MANKLFIVFLVSSVAFQAAAQDILKVQSGAVIKTTGNAIITLQDMDLSNDGTLSQAPGEGGFRFSGTADNTISGNSPVLMDVLQLVKSGAAKVSLLQNLNIGTSINFISGFIDLNNKNILLQPAALLTGESETSRIYGSSGGYVEISALLNNPSLVNPGNLGATISSPANMGSTIIRRGHLSQSNGYGGGNSILRYYDIIPSTNNSLNATLNFGYLDAELNGLTESQLTLWKNSAGNGWVDQGFSRKSTVTNYVERSGINDFSRWTLSTPGNALPVIFTLFNVSCDNGRVWLTWRTAAEQYSSRFEIQRSENGNNWLPVGTVTAAGFSQTEQTYSYADILPPGISVFYRIAEYDLNGRVQYSNIIRSGCGDTDSWKAWPNPVRDKLFFQIGTGMGSSVGLKLFDAGGKLVRQQTSVLLRGNNLLSMDMTGLARGNYQLVAEWNQGSERKTFKLVKQ